MLLPEDLRKVREDLSDHGFMPFRYSGRDMSGAYCLAVSLDTYGELLIIGGVLSSYQDLHDWVSDMKRDGFGLGFVIYFPNVKWPKTEAEEESPN